MKSRIRQIFSEIDQRIPRLVYAVLSPEDQKSLKQQIDIKFPNTTLNDQQACHHATLLFNPTAEAWNELKTWANAGAAITIQCQSICNNQEIQAIVVKLFNDVGVELNANRTLHITVSALPKVPPVRSNAMLNGEHESKPFTTKYIGKVEITY